jgi:hypothetical protein
MNVRHGKDSIARAGRRPASRARVAPLAAVLLALVVTAALVGAALPAGASAAPGKPTAKAPKGTITTATPTFKWSKVTGAAKYELSVTKGSKVLLKKTGLTKLSWKSSKALPKNVGLAWKVRASSASGNGAWSKSLAFRVALVIGDPYQGGKVAYIDGTGQHGLIAAVADQTTATRWYNGTFTATGATAVALGTGLANTTAIIASQGSPLPATTYAADLAAAYTHGGYSDWYLPSKDELNELFVNQVAIGGFDHTPGGDPGWGAGPYWSSSEVGTDFAWAQYFSAGTRLDGVAGVQHVDYKSGADYRVRAVRSF